MTKLSIKGLQEAQARNNKRIANLKPPGAFGKLIRYFTALLHRFMVQVTHVDTGALRASERMDVDGLHGRVYVDPNAVNPRDGKRTSVYGVFENARGGEHAFFDRTVAYGQRTAQRSVRAFLDEI